MKNVNRLTITMTPVQVENMLPEWLPCGFSPIGDDLLQDTEPNFSTATSIGLLSLGELSGSNTDQRCRWRRGRGGGNSDTYSTDTTRWRWWHSGLDR